MKRAMSLILALVMCLSLCACGGSNGGGGSGNNSGVKLTLDNYKDYLNVSTSFSHPILGDNALYVGDRGGVPYDGVNSGIGDSGTTFFLGKVFNAGATVEGVSPNFNYKDVSVTVRFSGNYQSYDLNEKKWSSTWHEFDTELVVGCNIAGSGRSSTNIEVTPYVHDQMVKGTAKVVAVSGNVIPVG